MFFHMNCNPNSLPRAKTTHLTNFQFTYVFVFNEELTQFMFIIKCHHVVRATV